MGLGRRRGRGERETPQAEVDVVGSPCSGRDLNTQCRLARRLDYRVLFRTIWFPPRTSRAPETMRSARIESTQIPRTGPLSGLRSFRALPMGRVP